MLPSSLMLLVAIAAGSTESATLARVAAEVRASSWELALDVVENAADADTTAPSLGREQLEKLGGLPNLVVELSAKLAGADRPTWHESSALALLVEAHAHQREKVGFSPRQVVGELLALRRVVRRFVVERAPTLTTADLIVAEQRLDETVDELVTECVAAYFDQATSSLAYRARHDPMTKLLNRHAFLQEFDCHMTRADRYGRELALVFFDCDALKRVNDSYGHAEGDRALQRLATLLRQTLRGSDVAARIGGDEFATLLFEPQFDAGERFLARLLQRLGALVESGELPAGFSVSGGVAYYPREGRSAEALFELADRRLYEAKRAKRRGSTAMRPVLRARGQAPLGERPEEARRRRPSRP